MKSKHCLITALATGIVGILLLPFVVYFPGDQCVILFLIEVLVGLVIFVQLFAAMVLKHEEDLKERRRTNPPPRCRHCGRTIRPMQCLPGIYIHCHNDSRVCPDVFNVAEPETCDAKP